MQQAHAQRRLVAECALLEPAWLEDGADEGAGLADARRGIGAEPPGGAGDQCGADEDAARKQRMHQREARQRDEAEHDVLPCGNRLGVEPVGRPRDRLHEGARSGIAFGRQRAHRAELVGGAVVIAFVQRGHGAIGQRIAGEHHAIEQRFRIARAVGRVGGFDEVCEVAHVLPGARSDWPGDACA